MKKWLITLSLIFCTVANCFGKGVVPPEIPESIKKYEKKVMRRFSQLKCWKKTVNPHILFVYYLQLTCDKDDKNTFTAENLFKNLEYMSGEPGEPKYFPRAFTTVYDDSLKELASGHGTKLLCVYHNQNDLKLEILVGNKFDYVFQIMGCDMNIYFACKEGHIYVFDRMNKENPLLPLETYMDLYWTDDFHNHYFKTNRIYKSKYH